MSLYLSQCFHNMNEYIKYLCTLILQSHLSVAYNLNKDFSVVYLNVGEELGQYLNLMYIIL